MPKAPEKLICKSANLRGLKTSWWSGGESQNPLLLFLHGYPDSPFVWKSQIAHYRDRFQLVIPFLRGTRLSESGEIARFRPDSCALDFLEILQEEDPTGKRPVYLVGHDIGAALAWNLAPLLGNRLQGLVTINGLSVEQMARRWKQWRQHLKSWYIYGFQIPLLPEALIRLFPGPLLALAHGRGELKSAERLSRREIAGGLVHPVKFYRAFARDLPQAMFRKPSVVQAPALVIWGNRDAFLMPPSLDELTPFASRVTVRILEGNHWLFREKASDVNRLMDEFFDRSQGSFGLVSGGRA